MGLGSFYKQRKPRSFNHKPIYYDQKRDELDKRIERIRREVEEEEAQKRGEAPECDYSHYQPHIRGTFIEGTQHLKEQQLSGIDQSSRISRTFRTLAMLILVCVVSWLLYKYLL